MTEPEQPAAPCDQCKWKRWITSRYQCTTPALLNQRPARLYLYTAAARHNPKLCGPDARWFEARRL